MIESKEVIDLTKLLVIDPEQVMWVMTNQRIEYEGIRCSSQNILVPVSVESAKGCRVNRVDMWFNYHNTGECTVSLRGDGVEKVLGKVMLCGRDVKGDLIKEFRGLLKEWFYSVIEL